MDRSTGFTLVELIVVLVIVGFIAAMAVPKFVDLSDHARVASGKADLATLREAAGRYYASAVSLQLPGSFPSSKTALEQELSTGLGTLTSAHYAYSSSTGLVTCSHSACCGT